MRALFLSTRLAGTDGVSLEADKLAAVMATLGFERHDCAGEVAGERATLIPEMHFEDALAQELGRRAFGASEPDPALDAAIDERAAMLAARILEVVERVRPSVLVLQNVWAIPMQLPLAKALAEVVTQTGLPCLSHEHDYYWERERFQTSRLPDFLDRYFPFDAPTVRHLCINSDARRDLRERRAIEARVLPNVFDFATPAPGLDAYNRDFREAIDLGAGQRLILQPTRVVPRKGIELAIDLLAALADPRNVLVITHKAGDEGLDYLRRLERQATELDVDLRYVADRVHDVRTHEDDVKIYALWDTYPHADFVTYPSLYEGFGNALLETIYFRKAALVNRYSVYRSDIAPKGFRFVEIDGSVTDEAVAEVAALLDDPARRHAAADHNYRLAERHFSYRTLEGILLEELGELGVL